ncbi:MAG TPA: hypothetical protein VFL57_10350 [Bryobacteraceae bacterium]|nr:hypothetical protein [Bryobacteraceae bacterium]
MGISDAPRNPLALCTRIAVFVCVALFYLWTTISSDIAPVGGGQREDYYNLLADAFLAGQLHLRVPPDPRLLALSNPRDPQANAPWRLHDASLYGGKYYLYFGPTPAVLAFVPYTLILGHDLPPTVAVAAFAFFTVLFSYLLLREWLHVLDVAVSAWVDSLVVVVLASCQYAPYVIRRPAHYEVAILSGSAFFVAGLWLLTLGLRTPRWLPAAGLCLALSAGSRPTLIPGVLAASVVYAAWLLATRKSLRALYSRELMTLAAPIIAVGVALACYNYARFDDPLEFGVTYHLGVLQNTAIKPDVRSIPPAAYYFLFAPLAWQPSFPFWHVVLSQPFGRQEWLLKLRYLERTAGLLPLFPLYLLGLLPLPALRLSQRIPHSGIVLAPVYVSAISILTSTAVTGFITIRYTLDFAPLLLVAALANVLLLVHHTHARVWRCALMGIFVLAGVSGILMSAAISITGPYGDTEMANPELYRKVANVFGAGLSPLREIERIEVELGVTFQRPRASQPEALLSSGRIEAGDVLFVRYLPGDKVAFAYDRWGYGTIDGAPFDALYGKPRLVTISYAKAGRTLTAHVDGALRFRAQTVLYPTRGEYVVLGRNRLPELMLRVGDFSGMLQLYAKRVQFVN